MLSLLHHLGIVVLSEFLLKTVLVLFVRVMRLVSFLLLLLAHDLLSLLFSGLTLIIYLHFYGDSVYLLLYHWNLLSEFLDFPHLYPFLSNFLHFLFILLVCFPVLNAVVEWL